MAVLNPLQAARREARETQKALAEATKSAKQAAKKLARLEGDPLPLMPAQRKVMLKKLTAELAHLRVKLGEVGVERLRLLAKRAEALTGESEPPTEGAPAKAGAEGAHAQPAAPGAVEAAKSKLEAAKKQLRAMRVDENLAKLEVKAQGFVSARGGPNSRFATAFNAPPSTHPPAPPPAQQGGGAAPAQGYACATRGGGARGGGTRGGGVSGNSTKPTFFQTFSSPPPPTHRTHP